VDEQGFTNMINMDGQLPSGFTNSNFCGIDRQYCDTNSLGISLIQYPEFGPRESWRSGLKYIGPS
jgi:hypothetical protein